MLLPTQQSHGLAATNLMQSMLDGIEEQRRQQEEERTGRERDAVSEARISASEEAKRAREKVAEALFGSNRADPNELKIQLIDRLATKLGIDTDEARSSFKLGRALEDALKDMDPAQIGRLEEYLGLKEIGISMATLLAAIKNPYGDDNARLMDGLTKKANGGKLDIEVERVVQRLEDVADPQTLEELKLGPQGYDPTRIEDEATRAERQEDIAAAEVSEKLGDVQDVQDAIEERTEAVAEGPAPGDSSVDDAEMLTVLAAASDPSADIAENGAAETLAGKSSSGSAKDFNANPAEGGTPITELTEGPLAALIAGGAERPENILTISIDEIGLYEFLKAREAA
jgi:hypothetical protein